jgi:hypothetical protein
MERLKVFEKLWPLLLASAAMSFGQTATMPQNYPYNTGQPQPGQHEMVSPGTVNYIEGQVSLDNQPVSLQGPTVMRPQDTLATGNGFAEVLLTPGAFIRMGPNSQIQLTTAGLAATQIQLDRGIANVEVDQLIQGTNLAVTMDGATAQLQKNGLYDFNADQKTVRVLAGDTNVVTASSAKKIGKDEQLLLASAKPLKAKSFDKKAEQAQPLYIWSEARSQNESQANVAVAQNVNSYGGWYGPGWYWDPYWSFYAYLPASGFLYSPFGWGFYSPAFIGYYGVPFGYGRGGFYGGVWHGQVNGMNAHISGFGGGFHGGGGGGRR